MALPLIATTPMANGRLALPVSWFFPNMPWLLLHLRLGTHLQKQMWAQVIRPIMVPLRFAMVFSQNWLFFRMIGQALVPQSTKDTLHSPPTSNWTSPMTWAPSL
jgi:hypothetical protein